LSRVPLRTETLLALACLGGVGLLAASEFVTTFEFTPPGGEALQASDAADRHHYALLVLAVFALAALVIALLTGAKPAALAIAVAGGIALLIFLIGDLPDAGKVGTLDDPQQSFIDAKAEPQLGFWLELIGAVILTVCGAALATMRPERIAVASRWARGERAPEAAKTETG
jgi:hypothetical protein